jgi:HAE1 family hydrophobic/amphiphilic exporter-1
MSLLTRWVLRRRAATVLITVLVIVLGAYAVTQLQEELFPSLSFPYLFVTTAYPGASSQVVANEISTPLESAASQLPGIQQVQSKSLQGFSIVTVEFNYGADVTNAQQTLETKVRSVTLPAMANGSAPQPTVTSVSFDSVPILYITAQSNSGQTPDQVARWADATAQPAFAKLGDVGSVQVVGDTSQQVNITLDPAKLAAYGLSAQSVIATLQADGITFPAGAADISSQIVPVNVSASFASASALGDIALAPSASGGSGAGSQGQGAAPTSAATSASRADGQTPTRTLPRLKDVATIQPIQMYPNGVSRIDGTQGVLLTIVKAQNGNTVKASDNALAEITQLNKDYPQYHLTAIYDGAQTIRDSINELVREGLLGALFAILVIFFFLRNVRSTLVTAISIPTSILVGFILMWNQGITLNTLTLGGLAIAVGRVVDDAIVVLENIYRHVQQGDPVLVAVQNGTREVASAITSSTITTVGVFLPLGFIGGIVGQAFLPFALTITFALAASLLVALTVVPVFASVFITSRVAAPERRDTLLQRAYTPVLRWGLRHRWLTLLVAGMLLAGTIASVVMTNVPTGLLPNSNTTLLQLSLNTAQGADPTVTVNAVDQIEQSLAIYKQQGKISLYETTLSGSSTFDRIRQSLQGSNTTATMLITLPPTQDAGAIAQDLRHDLASDTPTGGSIEVAAADSFGGGNNTLSYVVQGPDAASVKQGSDEVLNALQGLRGITNLKSDVSAVTPQIIVTPDPTKSPLANTALIGQQISALLQGQSGGTITFSDGTQAQVLVQAPAPSATNIDAYIANLDMLPLGGGLTLGDVATVQRIDRATQVTRINQSLAATISADITSQSTGPVTSTADQALAKLTLPKGVTLASAGVGQQQSQAFSGLALALIAAVALVYLVMVVAFGSLLEPFAILFSLPLAAIGGLGALVITQHELDISSMIGFLMLIGIVVTNAIVLMDLVNQLRKQGLAKQEALLEAGRTRVRPILMTAVATILALLPLALGLGGNSGSIIAADLGVVVIGGLLTSTLLTLVVVPVVYSLLDGARERVMGRHAPAEQPVLASQPLAINEQRTGQRLE